MSGELLFALVRRSIRLVTMTAVLSFGLQHREGLGEASAISCNGLSLTSEWQLFPDGIIYRLSLQVDDVFLARSTLERSKRLLGQHRVFHALSWALFRKQLENISDLLAQLGKPFHHLFTISKIVKHMFEVANLVVKPMFKIN